MPPYHNPLGRVRGSGSVDGGFESNGEREFDHNTVAQTTYEMDFGSPARFADADCLEGLLRVGVWHVRSAAPQSDSQHRHIEATTA